MNKLSDQEKVVIRKICGQLMCSSQNRRSFFADHS